MTTYVGLVSGLIQGTQDFPHDDTTWTVIFEDASSAGRVWLAASTKLAYSLGSCLGAPLELHAAEGGLIISARVISRREALRAARALEMRAVETRPH